jgi:pimeloyl-ACP methyl ester carboxylesterase
VPLLENDGVALHYEVTGSGAPVVLLHGFTSSLAGTWGRRGWIDFLTDNGFRVLGLDFRSHGGSDRVHDASRLTTEKLAADVVALLDHVGVARGAVWGFSMGGGVALHLAMHDPERVERVVVTGVGDAAVNRLHDRRQIAEILAAFEAESAAAVISPTAQAIRRSAEAAGNDPKALAPFLRCGGWPGGLVEQRPVTAPVLLVVADEDQYMAEVDELVRWLPHAHVERLARRDHYSVLDDERLRTTVLRFLTSKLKPRAVSGDDR